LVPSLKVFTSHLPRYFLEPSFRERSEAFLEVL
jgi:hypothetical protein